MGSRGPAPKRSAERVRTADPNAAELRTVRVDELIKLEVQIPAPSPDWHPVARRLYESLSESAQCVYYEPSDWAMAYAFIESMSRDFQRTVMVTTDEWIEGHDDPETGRWVDGHYKTEFVPAPLRGNSMTGYLQALSDLMVTETDRRRARIEIERVVQTGQQVQKQATPDELAARRENRAQGRGA